MIQLYWKNATAEIVTAEHGVTAAEMASTSAVVAEAHRAVLAEPPGYLALPRRTDYRDDVKALVAKHRPGTTDLVVLGIGGSALGSIALQAALNPLTYNLEPGRGPGSPRLFVLDNVDPDLIGETLALLGDRLDTTRFNVISKSGETAETASQFMIVRELLGAARASRIVATTDAEGGTLHDIARDAGYDTLAVPGDVGGRFSVLSPVGLFSAAMCGIDIDALLAGAKCMAGKVQQPDPSANPACVLAAVKHLMMTAKAKPIHVMMPYANRLCSLADWYRQLWAESLGKKLDRSGRVVHVGPTPVKALGATDQHSQIQLYREGPNDKLVVFLTVAGRGRAVQIPAGPADPAGLAYLGGHGLAELLAAEKTGTEYALAESDRPSVTIRFDAVDEESVGAFILFYEFVTSLVGELLDVNAYDQPAVQLGKDATFALMGRPGENYEHMARKFRDFATEDDAYLL